MARRSSRQNGPSIASVVVALIYCACCCYVTNNGVSAYRLEYPSISSVRVLKTTLASNDDNNNNNVSAAVVSSRLPAVQPPQPHKRIEFEVRGKNLFKGLPIRTTAIAAVRDAACTDAESVYNMTEVDVSESGDRVIYAIDMNASQLAATRTVRRRNSRVIYFCLPHIAVHRNRGGRARYSDDVDFEFDADATKNGVFDNEIIAPAIRGGGKRWYHQGDNIALDTAYWMVHDPDTDLDYADKTVSRGRRQDRPAYVVDRIRVTGLRVDTASKEPHFGDDGIPFLLVGSDYTLRLFGVGFSENTEVTFTQQKGNFGTACQVPVTGIFHVIKDSVSDDSVQVVVRIPLVEDDVRPLYICVKEGKMSSESESVLQSSPFVHQGSSAWLSFFSYEKVVPLWAAIVIICVCLCFSALFSGLNLGLMSLDRTELKILCNTGTEQEQRYAKKIQPVRNHGNFLLCSILLGNVLVNSTFTILLDDLTSGVIAILCSTLAIVMFGEITPQAICSRHGLAIGAKTIFVTKMVMGVTFPLSYPISRVLDVILGEEIGSVYTRERLKELVKVTTGENDLDKDEVNIISGALELRRKTVADVMTRIEDAFMLSYDTVLDFETVSEIMKSGYSRIPVFENDRKNIITTMYIKDLAFVDPDDNTPLKTLCQFYQNPCNFVFEDVTLDIMFKDFKEGNKGHMAFINRVNTEGEGDPFYETIGLITLEDVIEELIQAEIMDETDVFTDNRTKRKRNADRTKQDFTVFAERRGESNRIRISPQLTLATYQYLSSSIDMFKPQIISETILRRLLKQDLYHHIKKNKDWRNDPTTIIYQQRVLVDYFVLILEGRVEVKVGDENLTFESGPFTYFGTQALMPNISVAESPTALGSIQSLNMDSMVRHTFQPDYQVRACTEVLYLKLKRNLYMAAKRASLMQMSQRDSVTNGDAFEDEVEKFYDDSDDNRLHFVHSSPPDSATDKSQLLHSLEEEGSIGRRSPELTKQQQQLQLHELQQEQRLNQEHLLHQIEQQIQQQQQQQQQQSSVSQNASPRTPTSKTHISPTVGGSGGGSGSGAGAVRTFGSRELNGSVKHSSPNDDISLVSEKEEEEVSLLSKNSNS